MKRALRRGFTLVELLIVISILLLLTLLVIAVYNTNAGSDRIRSAARIAQSSFLGARDRALHAKDRRGLRLVRDPSDGSLVTGFVYLQPIPNQVYAQNSIQLERRDESPVDGIPDGPDVDIVHGFVAPAAGPYVNWFNIKDYFANPPRIRIPAQTGQWYTFNWTTGGQYALSATNPYLQLTASFSDPGSQVTVIAHSRSNPTFSTCEIEMGAELLPFHPPIALPSGVVIDLDWSSLNVQAMAAGGANADIMFSPRGMVTGPIAALGPLHFLLNDVRDATQGLSPIDPANRGEKLILTVSPLTGAVATFPIDPTDNINNSTFAAGPDGLADDLFHHAKVGAIAGN